MGAYGAVAQMGGQVVGAGGALVGGLLAADAAKKAAGAQEKAMQQIYDYTKQNMDPAVVNAQAVNADTERAKARLNLQGEVDPQLLAQRRLSEQILTGQLSGIGKSASDTVAQQATAEALRGVPGLHEGATDLVAAARKNLSAGATLPPDVQAALMQAGLQQTGQVQGAATSRGAGGAILQQVLGMGAINLQAQREAQAASLMQSASSLEANRQQILQGLFPKLQQQQMSNIAGTSGILQQSNNMLPQAGLSGADVASIWLSRVGALNQIAGNQATVKAQGMLSSGLMKAGAIGTMVGLGQGASKDLGGTMASYFNSSQSGGGGGGGGSTPNWAGNSSSSMMDSSAGGGGDSGDPGGEMGI